MEMRRGREVTLAPRLTRNTLSSWQKGGKSFTRLRPNWDDHKLIAEFECAAACPDAAGKRNVLNCGGLSWPSLLSVILSSKIRSSLEQSLPYSPPSMANHDTRLRTKECSGSSWKTS